MFHPITVWLVISNTKAQLLKISISWKPLQRGPRTHKTRAFPHLRLKYLPANAPRFPLPAFPSTAQECGIQKALVIKREPHAVGTGGPRESTTGAVCHALTGVSEKDGQEDPNAPASERSQPSEPLAPNEQVPPPRGASSIILLLLPTPGFQGRLRATDFRGGGGCPLALPGRVGRETLPPLPRLAAGRAAGPRRGRAGGGPRGEGGVARRSPLPRAPGGAGVSLPPFPALERSPSPAGASRTWRGRRLRGPSEGAGEENGTGCP